MGVRPYAYHLLEMDVNRHLPAMRELSETNERTRRHFFRSMD